MILSYSEFREQQNDNSTEILVTVVEQLQEYGELSFDNMLELFENVAEFHGYEIEDFDEYVNSLAESLLPYLNVSTNESDENFYSLNSDLIEEGVFGKAAGALAHKDAGRAIGNAGKIKGLFAKSTMGHISGMVGGAAKEYSKGQKANAKAGLKKQKNLMGHDYKMAKLSAKSRDGGFDNYQKLAGSANNRY